MMELLELPTHELDRLVRSRSADPSNRFAFCRALGSRIRDERVKEGWRATDVAGQIGVDVRCLRLLELGVVDGAAISDELVEALAEGLGIDAAELRALDRPSAMTRLLAVLSRAAGEFSLGVVDATTRPPGLVAVRMNADARVGQGPPVGIRASEEADEVRIEIRSDPSFVGRVVVARAGNSDGSAPEVARSELDFDGSARLVVGRDFDAISLFLE